MESDMNGDVLETLKAKDEIRDLVLLYCRGIDRKDVDLLHSLYTEDSMDLHGDFFQGSGKDYVDFYDQSKWQVPYLGHHVCNHLISVDGNEAHGEVYALGIHIVSDGKGGFMEDIICVRYLDNYRKENGQWRFAKRNVVFDLRNVREVEFDGREEKGDDISYTELKSRIFARGASAIS
jgi:ketosteroid isomerase-like protein